MTIDVVYMNRGSRWAARNPQTGITTYGADQWEATDKLTTAMEMLAQRLWETNRLDRGFGSAGVQYTVSP